MKQKLNVVDDNGKRRIGVLDSRTKQVTTSDRKVRPFSHYANNGDIKRFEKYKNGKLVKD